MRGVFCLWVVVSECLAGIQALLGASSGLQTRGFSGSSLAGPEGLDQVTWPPLVDPDVVDPFFALSLATERRLGGEAFLREADQAFEQFGVANAAGLE